MRTSVSLSWSRDRAFWLVVGAGLLLRLAWWAYARPAVVSDFEYYRRTAEWFLRSGEIGLGQPSAIRVPAYPVFLAALMLVSKSHVWLSFANVLLSALLPWLIYRLAFVLTTDRVVAVLAGLLCALDPTLVLFSPVLASEHLFAAGLFGSLLWLCQASSRRATAVATHAIAGWLFALAVLSRPEALFYLPVFGLAIWRFVDTKSAARRSLIFSIAALLLITPWWVRNRIVIGPGAGLSTMGGRSFYQAHNSGTYGYQDLAGTPLAGLNELDRQTRGYQAGWQYIREASLRDLASDLVEATAYQFSVSDDYAQFWSTRAPGRNPDQFGATNLGARRPFTRVILWWNVLLFVAAGASLVFLRRFTWHVWATLYGIVILNWIGYCVVFEATARYRYAAQVVLCILAAITLRQVRAPGRPGTM